MATVIRTVPEQVSKNAQDIDALKKAYIGGVDVDKIDFTNEDLSSSPDYEKTLPDADATMTDVEAESAIVLLKSFIKKGYIIYNGYLIKLYACKQDELSLEANFSGIAITISGLTYTITYQEAELWL